MQTLSPYDIDQLKEKVQELEEKSVEFKDSITYASGLQLSMLPNIKRFTESFNDAFTYYRPKDIVSGDFYWTFKFENRVYVAVGDCTGHGVPGAMVSMAVMTELRNIIRIVGLRDPARIMYKLDEEVTALFNEHVTDGVTRDGVDMAFCRFDLEQGKGYYTGAGRPLILIRDGDLVELSGTSFHIGYLDGFKKGFFTKEFNLYPGDKYYLFSDGYTDQFGGEKVKKFNRKRFRNLLLSIAEMPLKQQHKELDLAFSSWKGKQEQIDDVCVVGLKI